MNGFHIHIPVVAMVTEEVEGEGVGIEEVGAEVTGIVVIEIGEEEEVVGSGVIER